MNTMKQLSTLCVAAFACVGLAQAQDSASPTRAQVKAELQAARASGEMAALVGEDGGSFWLAQHMPVSVLTRKQVRDTQLAGRDGVDWSALNGEDGGSMAMNRRPTLPYAGPDHGDTRHARENKSGNGG